MGTINTAIAQRESDIRSERVKAAVERNVKLGEENRWRSRGRSATRSIITTLAKGPSVSVASLAKSWNRLEADAVREAVSRGSEG